MKKKLLFILYFFVIIGFQFSDSIIVKGIGSRQKIINVDNDAYELNLSKTVNQITEIEGIEKLKNLRKLKIAFSDITTISSDFWKSISEIHFLEIGFGTINDFSFLQYLPNLITLSVYETYIIEKNCNLNLKNNEKLEYIELHGIHDIAYPCVIYPPNSLKVLDIKGSVFRPENEDEFLVSLANTDIVLIINDKQYQQLKDNKNFANIKFEKY